MVRSGITERALRLPWRVAAVVVLALTVVFCSVGRTDEATDSGAAAMPGAANADGTRVVVLCYHGVSRTSNNIFSLSPGVLEKQFAYLAAHGYSIISLAQLQAWLADGAALPARPVLLTFDDWPDSQYQIVRPLLEKHGFPATFFVITGRLAAASAQHIRAWRAPGITFGSHSVTHPSLPALDGAALDRELVDSRAALTSLTGGDVQAFAFPSGHFNEGVLAHTREAGYTLGFTTIPGPNSRDVNPLALQRTVIQKNYSMLDFKKVLRNDRQLLSAMYRHFAPGYLKLGQLLAAATVIDRLAALDGESSVVKKLRAQVAAARRARQPEAAHSQAVPP